MPTTNIKTKPYCIYMTGVTANTSSCLTTLTSGSI